MATVPLEEPWLAISVHFLVVLMADFCLPCALLRVRIRNLRVVEKYA